MNDKHRTPVLQQKSSGFTLLSEFNNSAQTIMVVDSNVENSDFRLTNDNWTGASALGAGGNPALFVLQCQVLADTSQIQYNGASS